MDTEKDAPYWRVLNSVLTNIQDGVHPPGSRLPSERALAETHGVSRSTVSRAMEKLRWIGLITGPAGGTARVATEPRRSLALGIVEQADRVRNLDDASE